MRSRSVWLIGFLLFAAGATFATVLLSWIRPAAEVERASRQAQSEEAVTPIPASAPVAEDPLEAAALAAVRARLAPADGRPGLFELRVYRFGPADEVAVCGLVVGRDGTTAEPFVARVLFARTTSTVLPPSAPAAAARSGEGGGPALSPRLRASMPLVVIEEGPGLWRSGLAQRRYCRDADPSRPPPAPEAATVTAAVPAAPVATAGPMASGGVTAATGAADRDGFTATGTEITSPAAASSIAGIQGDGALPAEASSSAERVALRSPANIRMGPGGDYPVITTAPRGTGFRVQDRAPGGWVRVSGADGLEGWVHSSLLQ
ncbi:MAG: SH3 domain-containing protein [Acetobacteraceae bacterium]|nr:SH3 domain-containing protein [Acetobacteraceae bacterium]